MSIYSENKEPRKYKLQQKWQHLLQVRLGMLLEDHWFSERLSWDCPKPIGLPAQRDDQQGMLLTGLFQAARVRAEGRSKALCSQRQGSVRVDHSLGFFHCCFESSGDTLQTIEGLSLQVTTWMTRMSCAKTGANTSEYETIECMDTKRFCMVFVLYIYTSWGITFIFEVQISRMM